MISIVVIANLAVRLFVELLGVGFVGYWGLNASDDATVGWALGIGAIVAFVVVWGLFLAPNAAKGPSKARKDILAVIVLLVAAGALALAGEPVAALTYSAVVVVNAGILYVLRDDVSESLANFGVRG